MSTEWINAIAAAASAIAALLAFAAACFSAIAARTANQQATQTRLFALRSEAMVGAAELLAQAGRGDVLIDEALIVHKSMAALAGAHGGSAYSEQKARLEGLRMIGASCEVIAKKALDRLRGSQQVSGTELEALLLEIGPSLLLMRQNVAVLTETRDRFAAEITRRNISRSSTAL